MRYWNLLAWRRSTIALSIVAAVAAVAALLALAPPLAQGSPAGVTHQNSPATMAECREEMDAGRAVACTANRFSVKTIRPQTVNTSSTGGVGWNKHDNIEAR